MLCNNRYAIANHYIAILNVGYVCHDHKDDMIMNMLICYSILAYCISNMLICILLIHMHIASAITSLVESHSSQVLFLAAVTKL